MDQVWQEAITFLRRIPENDLHERRCVRWVAEHIVKQGYTAKLIPWPSFSSLKISLPEHGLLCESVRLHLQYDPLRAQMSFKYNDYRGLEKFDRERSLKWSITCQPTEGIDTLEHFINEHPEWSRAIGRN